MSREKELAKNTAILTIGKICTQCISFFLLPLYTAILSTEEYGSFDLLITYATLMLPIVNWQLDQGLFRFMIDCRGKFEEQSSLFSTLLCFSTIQNVFYLLIFCMFKRFLKIEHSGFLVVYVILHVYSALLLQFVRGLGQSVIYTIASFISAVATTVTNVLALAVLRMGLSGLFISTVIAQIITIIYLLFKSNCLKYISIKKVSLSIFNDVKKYSLPLVPNNLAWWVVNVSDRTIVSKILGVAVNGIYSVANKFPNVFIQFYNIFNLSWTETVSLHYRDNDRDEFLSDTITYMFKIFSSICYVIVAIMPFVYPIMVDKKYSEGYNQVLILMYAMLFRVLVGMYSCIYVAQKNAKKIAYTAITAAIINISVHLVLIWKIQLYAASISTLIAFFAMFIVRYFDINKELSMRIKRDVLLRSLMVGMILIFVYYSNNIVFQAVGAVVTIVYSYMINVDVLKAGINMVLHKIGLMTKIQESNS